MIAVDKDRAAARQVSGIGDEQVLSVAALYGANGSGKTNLIDALAWLSHSVARSLRDWEDSIPVDPFCFFPGSEPTRFGIEMLLDDVRYCYELEVEESGRRVRSSVQLPAATPPNAVRARGWQSDVQARYSLDGRRARIDHSDDAGHVGCQPPYRRDQSRGALAAQYRLRGDLATGAPSWRGKVVPPKVLDEPTIGTTASSRYSVARSRLTCKAMTTPQPMSTIDNAIWSFRCSNSQTWACRTQR